MSPHLPPRRPSWWPADEPWPPRGPMLHGRRWRGRFMWRLIGFLFFLPVLFIGGCGMLVGLTLAGKTIGPPVHPSPFFLIVGVLVIVSAVGVTVRTVWRLASPVGDLVEAVGRVEAGDYAARASERGPREIRSLARAFNAMTARLQANEQQRRNLLADVTHELRTPLTVIQGHLEGVLDGVYPADDAHLTPILDETRVLSRLIDDLRTLALAESGALQLHREPTDLGILVHEAVTAFRAAADAAGVALRVDAPEDVPLMEIDPVRIREVLTNLISNALRYTPRDGRISVTVAVEAARVVVAVADTGSGFPPEMLLHIFDRFYKSDASRGSGLGLAIAKNLVTAHGGDITAHSAPGQGALFRFTLPRETAAIG
jgi:two-component system sensor histidine kinase BaeS